MKLDNIKIAGFKTFVDPTFLALKGQLVGVVGPNGCGKSNIIDAVRWVMGEGSAKALRGESMADVIFNGSSGRQPVGRASVELCFDNKDGSLGGEYAKYNEISIKREVTRDGQSDYYLNSTRCRKKDIVDIFLGTGLGPRSYSIIEQGMISRVIESKAESLREFFEEAAGTSVYKRRRHDTELRMRHTIENLNQLEYLMQEQTKQLEKLKKQSGDARKFNEYQKERILLDSQVSVLKYQEYEAYLQCDSSIIRDLAIDLEQALASRASLDADLEKMRATYTERNDQVNKIQSVYYDLGAEIARKEQILQHQRERFAEISAEFKSILITHDNLNKEFAKDNATAIEIEEKLIAIEPEYTQANMQLENSSNLLEDAEIKLQEWNEAWEQYSKDSQTMQQQAEVGKEKITQLERQTRDLQVRLDRLAQERQTLHPEQKQQLVAELIARNEELEINKEDLTNVINLLSSNQENNRSQLSNLQKSADSIRLELQSMAGRISSLQTLQEAALGKNDIITVEWLNKQGLTTNPRLAELIQIDAEWSSCLELVLSYYLQAVVIEDLDKILEVSNSLENANLAFISKTRFMINLANNPDNSLLSKITSTELDITNLLQNIYVADNLESAQKLLTQLEPHCTVVTKDGMWLSHNWLRIQREDNPELGILDRKQELEQLQCKELQLQQDLAAILEKIEQENSQIMHYAQQQKDKTAILRDLEVELRKISNDLSSNQTSLSHILSRIDRITQEQQEHQQTLEENSIEAREARLLLETAINKMAEFAEQKQILQASKEKITAELKEIQYRVSQDRDKLHDIDIERSTISTKQHSIKESLLRLNKQIADLLARKDFLEDQLTKLDQPEDSLKGELDLILADRLKIEADLNSARTTLEETDLEIKTKEKSRASIEKQAEETRNKLDEYRINRQTYEVKKETILEYIQQNAIDLDSISKSLPDNLSITELTASLERVVKKIESLGAINLAAIEEYDAEVERKEYMDAQYKDLTEALQTLETAIAKIDRETKTKFKHTFDQVNATFKVLFPKLFGGGEAYLELTGDDLLEAGVTVMARPPGKKNSSIHLLSGGEKALTAVSLVFSIFQLNPAPFCMLDEVDAPLDDSNVGRFCNMLKEMSDKVQFIFITHNKITMEIANQLAGVTMKEPGVSRLVSVDIAEALEMVV